MKFNPCRGGNNCTEGGSRCNGCGRSHEEIAETRQIVDAVAQFALKMGYENVSEFTGFVADKAAGKVQRLRAAGTGVK